MTQAGSASGETAELCGPLTPEAVRELALRGPLYWLRVRQQPLFDAALADALLGIAVLENAQFLCSVTRAALQRLLQIAGLRCLYVNEIAPRGSPANFENASLLERFGGDRLVHQADLLAITRSPALREFYAIDSRMTAQTLDAFLAMPTLEMLSLEDCGIDDALAARFERCPQLQRLFLANNPLGREGLTHIARLKQLRELDLWATPLHVDDFEQLQQLPHLEYLSVGHTGSAKTAALGLTAEALLPRLSALTALRRLELDGINVDEKQRAAFAARFESVQILNR
ncbi:hypothetical protein [Tahibacter aquaticus]|uniref:hypothetical protein n=1 Tax=Tahibacter aquaticus TaxID=520092 RepID=UPI00105DCBF7|nr:hypothetical protein [Tahibacter aquaticus]